MSLASPADPNANLTRALIEELLRTAFSLQRALASLIESLPEDAFEEDNAEVLMEMVVGTCRPAVEAAGDPACRATIALVAAVRDRFLTDLKAAARISRRRS
jgi:hypothetical protein